MVKQQKTETEKNTTKKAQETVLPLSPERTQAEKIWDDIKDKSIEMFALPGQTPKKYCNPIMVEPTKLYLKTTVNVVLPALEEALKQKYDVEMQDKYIVVSVKTSFPSDRIAVSSTSTDEQVK